MITTISNGNVNNLELDEAWISISPSQLRAWLLIMLLVELFLSLYFHCRQYIHVSGQRQMPEIVRTVSDGIYTDLDFTLAQDDTLNRIVHHAGTKVYIVALWMTVIYFNIIPLLWNFTTRMSFIWRKIIPEGVARNMNFAMLSYASFEMAMFPVKCHLILVDARRFGLYFSMKLNYLTKHFKKTLTSLIPLAVGTGILTETTMILEKKPVATQILVIGCISYLFVVLYPSFEIWWLTEAARTDASYNYGTTENERQLRKRLRALCHRVGFPRKHLILVKKDSVFCFAFYYGFLWFQRILVNYNYRSIRDTEYEEVFYPSPLEIEGIFAHELGHWWHSHSNKGLILWHFMHLSTVILTYCLHTSETIYQAVGFPTAMAPVSSTATTATATTDQSHQEAQEKKTILQGQSEGLMYMTGALTSYWLILRMYLYFFEAVHHLCQQFCEQEADTFAADLGYDTVLSKGLLKIFLDQQKFPSSDIWYSLFYNDHPSLVKRLQLLRNPHKRKR